MDVSSSSDTSMTAGIYSLNKAKDVQSEQVLGALGMTPETQKAQQVIDSSMKQGIAQATGQGMSVDFKA